VVGIGLSFYVLVVEDEGPDSARVVYRQGQSETGKCAAVCVLRQMDCGGYHDRLLGCLWW
jgi:hypothetical protein